MLGRLTDVVVNDTATEHYEYDAFGNRTVLSGDGDVVPFGFAGGLFDEDTGLVRFGARDYEPVVGRWVTKDPIRSDGDGPNLYGYVLAIPMNQVDPSGEGFVDCARAIQKYLQCKDKLDQRRKGNECNPDRGHDKAIEQRQSRCDALREKAFNACKDPATWGPLLLGAGVGIAIGIATGGGAVAVGVGAAAAM